MDYIVHVHGDIHACCEECHLLLGPMFDSKLDHYASKHGYVLRRYTQTLPGPYGKLRHTEVAILGHPASKTSLLDRAKDMLKHVKKEP